MIIPSPPVEWRVLYTGVYNTQVHTTGNVTFDALCIKSAACCAVSSMKPPVLHV